MPLDVARNYLVENQGRQFDPACVEAFLSRWDEVVEIAAGQQATPYQKTEAHSRAHYRECGAEDQLAEPVPAA